MRIYSKFNFNELDEDEHRLSVSFNPKSREYTIHIEQFERDYPDDVISETYLTFSDWQIALLKKGLGR